MQTSSNFFNKSLLTLEEDSVRHKKKDKYHESHIVPDPLRLKEQLTPWTEINPKYNFNTERLVRFKQESRKQSLLATIQNDSQAKKQVKSDIVSNLFNFYKNNREPKKSTLNNVKRKSKQKEKEKQKQKSPDNSWTLPPIDDKAQLQLGLIKNNQQNSTNSNKQKNKIDLEKQTQKNKATLIQSISIRQYLKKLREKQKIFDTSSDAEKTKKENQQKEHFISKRFMRNKSKEKLSNSINLVREARKAQLSYRYAPIRNPETYTAKKKSMSSHFQSLQQSFQLYKRAAQKEIQQNSNINKRPDQSHKQINSLLAEKSLFKSNIPLSSLLSSINMNTIETAKVRYDSSSPSKKFNTISYETPFSPSSQKSLLLPKVNKNFSYHK